MDQRELAVITRLLGSDIKKPTALVHFQRQMSQVAQRIMTLLIFNAQETEPDAKGLYEARVKFVHDFLGWTDSKNYERIYEAFREIKSNDIVWNFLGEDRTLDELRCSFLITLGISRRSGAKAARTCKVSREAKGVSTAMNSTRLSIKLAMKATLRASRSSLAMTRRARVWRQSFNAASS